MQAIRSALPKDGVTSACHAHESNMRPSICVLETISDTYSPPSFHCSIIVRAQAIPSLPELSRKRSNSWRTGATWNRSRANDRDWGDRRINIKSLVIKKGVWHSVRYARPLPHALLQTKTCLSRRSEQEFTCRYPGLTMVEIDLVPEITGIILGQRIACRKDCTFRRFANHVRVVAARARING